MSSSPRATVANSWTISSLLLAQHLAILDDLLRNGPRSVWLLHQLLPHSLNVLLESVLTSSALLRQLVNNLLKDFTIVIFKLIIVVYG